MKCVVIGATAGGCLLATALARAGEEVSLLLPADRAPESEALRLTITGPGHDEARWAIVPTITALTEPPEFAVLALPDREIAQILPTIMGVLGHAPVLVTGVSPHGDDLASEALGASRMLRGVLVGTLVLERPGSVHVAGDLHLIVAGMPANDTGVLAGLVEAFRATLSVSSSEDGTGCRWSATLLDLAQAPAALADLSMIQALADRRVQHRTLATLREATHLLNVAHITLAPLPEHDMLRMARLHAVPALFAGRALRQLNLSSEPADALPETLAAKLRAQRRQDLADACAAFQALAERTGIAIPTIDLLATQAREHTTGIREL